MRFKSILCVVDFKQSDRDIKEATDLCIEMNAHLSVLVIALATPPPIGGTLHIADKWMAQREADIAKLRLTCRTGQRAGCQERTFVRC